MAHISLSKGSNKQPQYKSISQNDLQEAETENGDESDEESEDDDSEDEIVAIIDSESEDEDPHEESEDESDEMHAPMIYEGPVTSRSWRQCMSSARYQDCLALVNFLCYGIYMYLFIPIRKL